MAWANPDTRRETTDAVKRRLGKAPFTYWLPPVAGSPTHKRSSSSTWRPPKTKQGAPADIDELPGVLRDECVDPVTAYRSPGALLLAYRGHVPIGCVGLKPMGPPGTIEVKRLYVRPAHRRVGAARTLMQHAHRHAVDSGFVRLVLDVMPTRTHVIDFYRRLGYSDAGSPTEAPDSMVYLQRPTCI